MIRRAAPKDAPALRGLIDDVIALPHITFRSAPKTEAEIDALIAGPVWVAEEAGRIIGYASYGPFRSSDGYRYCAEHSIAIAPDSHGRGVARALMATLEHHAADAGLRVLVAGVSGSNPAAIAFHEALGFTFSGRLPAVGYKSGAWHDLVFLTKPLSGSQSDPPQDAQKEE